MRALILGATVALSPLLVSGCLGESVADSSPSSRTAAAVGEAAEACSSPDECRENWSRAVAKAAGYQIIGNTGSAWVAQGRGHSFYFWATEVIPASQLRSEGYRILRRVKGVPIYADSVDLTDNINLTWRARRATLWIQAGPTKDSVAPKPNELRRLVAASIALPIR
jgi:hypothetical protein